MSSDEQLLFIRGLLERQVAKADAIEAKVDAHRAEGERRGHEQAAGLEAVRVEVQRLNSRMTDAEKDIRELRETDGAVLRQQSEADYAHEAALGGAIAHAHTLAETVNALKDELAEVKDSTARAEKADRALFNELGIDYTTTTSDSPSVPPRRPAKTTLAKLALENKSSVAAGVVSTVLLIVQIVWKLLEHR